MSKVVNLRTVRKRKLRERKRRDGDRAAALSGETPAQRRSRIEAEARMARHVEGHRRDADTDGDGVEPE